MTDISSIKMPDAIFWDWDGTLADSYSFLNDAHNHTLITLGFAPFKEDEYKDYFGKPREILYPAIYKDKCDRAKDIFQAYVLDNSHKIQVLPDSYEILNFLYKNNIKMGIVSNKKSSFIAKELNHLGWSKFFSIVIGAGDAQADKPSAAPLLLALEKTGIDNEVNDIWYIGDTENDLACAKNAKCQAIFLVGDKNSKKLIAQYNPLISFDSYSKLKEILVAI